MSEWPFKPLVKKGDRVSVLYTPHGWDHPVRLYGIVNYAKRKSDYCVVETLINRMGCKQSELRKEPKTLTPPPAEGSKE